MKRLSTMYTGPYADAHLYIAQASDTVSGGLAVGRGTCDLLGSIPAGPLSRNIRSTQPCIPPGSLDRVPVPALAEGKGGILS